MKVGWNATGLSREYIKMLNTEVREGLKESVVLKKRLERFKKESHVDVWGKAIQAEEQEVECTEEGSLGGAFG